MRKKVIVRAQEFFKTEHQQEYGGRTRRVFKEETPKSQRITDRRRKWRRQLKEAKMKLRALERILKIYSKEKMTFESNLRKKISGQTGRWSKRVGEIKKQQRNIYLQALKKSQGVKDIEKWSRIHGGVTTEYEKVLRLKPVSISRRLANSSRTSRRKI